MKVVDVQQGSVEWLSARAGIVTASEVDALVSPLFKIRDSKGVDTYLAQKLAEKFVGGPIAGAMTLQMESGQLMEREAVPFFEFETGYSVQRVGLITDDAGQIGCSPDGLIGEEMGLELKCPMMQTHVKYLLANELPADYAAQVQFSLYVTKRACWRFMSYCRQLPPLMLTVEPDPKAQAAFSDAVPAFLERMAAGWKRLCELNGGEPARNTFREQIVNQPKPESFDVIP